MSGTKISALTAVTRPVDGDLELPLADGAGVANYRAAAWNFGAFYAFTEETSGATGIEFELPDEDYIAELVWSDVRWSSTSSSHFGFDIWWWGDSAYSTANLYGAIYRHEAAGISSASMASSPVVQTHRWLTAFDATNYPFAGVARLDCVAGTQPMMIWGRSSDYELFSGSYYPENTYFWVSTAQSNPAAKNRIRKIRFRRADSANITGWFGVRRLI